MADEEFRATELSDKPFVPMPEATPVPEPPENFRSDHDGLRNAAHELRERREDSAPPVPRKYFNTVTGEERPSNETISAKRGARDLTDLRHLEKVSQEKAESAQVAAEVDAFRANAAAADAGQYPQPEQPAPEVQQPQPEAQAQAPQPNGIDPEVAQALQNPKIRAALEQEAYSAAAARHAYGQAAQEATRFALAGALAVFPELSNLNAEQLPVALQMMQQRSSSRRLLNSSIGPSSRILPSTTQ